MRSPVFGNGTANADTVQGLAISGTAIKEQLALLRQRRELVAQPFLGE